MDTGTLVTSVGANLWTWGPSSPSAGTWRWLRVVGILSPWAARWCGWGHGDPCDPGGGQLGDMGTLITLNWDMGTLVTPVGASLGTLMAQGMEPAQGDTATQGRGWLRAPCQPQQGCPMGTGTSPCPQRGLRAGRGPLAPAGAWAALGASWRGNARGCRVGAPRAAPPGPPASTCG